MPTPRRQTGSGGSLRRRRLLQWPAAALAVSPLERLVAQASTDGGDVRLALLIGNRVYPAPHDLPSIRKNVDDMAVALRLRGFDVSAHVDLDLPKSREAIDLFAQKCKSAPDDAIVFFYFSGHGSQFEAKNLLVAAGVNPTAEPKAIQDGSIVLGPDVLDRVPRPARGLTVAVVDACRTSLKALAPGEGLNQVEAPTGCLIAFSTGAGKPALAPAVENLNTFYTAALVKQLNDASDELTFSDLFRLAPHEAPGPDHVADNDDDEIGGEIVRALRGEILAACLAIVGDLQEAAEQMAAPAIRAFHRKLHLRYFHNDCKLP